jgi:hypothetical protein
MAAEVETLALVIPQVTHFDLQLFRHFSTNAGNRLARGVGTNFLKW